MVKRPLLLGHRGARSVHALPENTMPSFELALAHGCDGFEFDVRRTADGYAVVCHDPRIGGREIAGASAADLPRMPLLEQVLEAYAERAFLNIELKVPGLEEQVVQWTAQYLQRDRFIVSSFLPDVLVRLSELDRDIPLGLIGETVRQLSMRGALSLQSVMAHCAILSPALLEQIHGNGQQVFGWTVNREAEMRRFAEWGVDGIISDDTRLLVETLGGR